MITLPTNDGRTPCTTADPALFDADESQTDLVAAAKKLCRACPITASCAQYALNNPTECTGIWGGLTESERHGLRTGRIPARALTRKVA